MEADQGGLEHEIREEKKKKQRNRATLTPLTWQDNTLPLRRQGGIRSLICLEIHLHVLSD